ncbi:alpha-beta hydrolase superfamily lysophospholipase [Rhizobium sp. SG_E_25_P2]|uniref:alpha/beta hydrolase n=1 Tax=Rhizobium sp. SG_E_25_P2 TaxID=2879942 RepID=UPI0024761B7B|nr:alpha/beta fold hydrolase [Rhizobium sp. SG_E_25_P2]MDH6268787.1 alpha-beta hydrolase superfamily lysophospholipase [Rhizobium sp. SG_E_25_P2]
MILIWTLIATALAAGVVYALGPRETADLTITFNADEIGADLDDWIAQGEARYDDIRPNLEKRIVWRDGRPDAETPLALVYIHGFSASPGEMRPVPENLAQRLGAHLFLTRLTGHGRADPDAMAEASLQDWLNDTAEALAIGERLGRKVVIMATSTGASLVTILLARPIFRDRIAAVIFVSPNYGVQAAGAFLLEGPWARRLAHLILGPRRGFEPATPGHAANWTSDYPTDALLPMAESVKQARTVDPAEITTPALFLISPRDRVIRPDLVRDMQARWGGPSMLIEVEMVQDPYFHVLAGDALSPATNDLMANRVADWVETTLAPPSTQTKQSNRL